MPLALDLFQQRRDQMKARKEVFAKRKRKKKKLKERRILRTAEEGMKKESEERVRLHKEKYLGGVGVVGSAVRKVSRSISVSTPKVSKRAKKGLFKRSSFGR